MALEPYGSRGKTRWQIGAGLVLMAIVLAEALATRSEHAQASDPSGRQRPKTSVAAGRISFPPAATSPRPGAIGFATALLQRTSRDNLTVVAAGVAFYFMLAIFPGFAALVSIFGLFTDPNRAADILTPFSNLLPGNAFDLLATGLKSFAAKSGSELSVALIVSLVIALWSARSGISSLMSGLDIVFEEVDQRSFILQIAVSAVLTLATLALALIVLLSIAIVPPLLSFFRVSASIESFIAIGRWPVMAIIVAISIAVLYRFAPYHSHPHWRWVTWGSATATLLWLLGSAGFSIYVSHFGNFDATYGSLGAAVVLLLWFWVTALVILFGGEIDAEIEARESGAS